MAAKGKFHPGDAANAFVRVILSDAGEKLGGLTPTEWDDTFRWFGGRCAYTSDALVAGRMDRDHAIPMNRKHCGLHLYGNVLPATKEANQRKAGEHYRHFVEDRDRLEQIESFVRESGYWERVSVFGDLQRYCEAQYRSIDALCRVNQQYLASLLPEDLTGSEATRKPVDFNRVIPRKEDTLRRSQRDVMRRLHQEHAGKRAETVAAYAAAEEAGEVNRRRNRLHLTRREYAERLFSDGIAKGWLVD